MEILTDYWHPACHHSHMSHLPLDRIHKMEDYHHTAKYQYQQCPRQNSMEIWVAYAYLSSLAPSTGDTVTTTPWGIHSGLYVRGREEGDNTSCLSKNRRIRGEKARPRWSRGGIFHRFSRMCWKVPWPASWCQLEYTTRYIFSIIYVPC